MLFRQYSRLAAALLLAGSAMAQSSKEPPAGARDMFFGGFDAAPTPKAAAGAGTAKRATPATVRKTTTPATSARSLPAHSSSPAATTNNKPAVPVVNAANIPLGLRYSILKLNGAQATEVAPSTRFQSGDRIQLKVQTNSDGYLYIVTQGSSGAWQVIFPSRSSKQGSNKVAAGEEHTRNFRFDAKPGVEKLFVVLSRAPERDLDAVIYNLGKGGSPGDAARPPRESAAPEPMLLAGNLTVQDPLVSRLRTSYSRDLVLEEVAAPEQEEKAVYVVTKTKGLDARVVADIKLAHE